jgi:hypothetical protein
MSKKIKTKNNNSFNSINNNLTLDTILGINVENESKTDSKIDSKIETKNEKKIENIFEEKEKEKEKEKKNNNNDVKPKITEITDITNIDYILNNGTVKFDNKLQTSMFFVDYKSINSFANTLKTKFNINIPKEIIDSHIINHIPTIIKEYTCNLKKRCKKIINVECICLGRKLDNKQCTRKKQNGTDFCKSHLIKLSNGRIDDPIQSIVRNKRGRKRKVEFDPRQYDNEYITLWEDIINGHKVLVDGNNNVYTYDLQAPQYICKKYIDTKIDFSKFNKEKPNAIESVSEEKIKNKIK